MGGVRRPERLRLGELVRLMNSAARAGQPVRQVTIDSDGQIKLTMGAPQAETGPGENKGDVNEWNDLLPDSAKAE